MQNTHFFFMDNIISGILKDFGEMFLLGPHLTDEPPVCSFIPQKETMRIWEAYPNIFLEIRAG